MIEFKHSTTGSIRCPHHNRRESFTAGDSLQPLDPLLVRYPCGYVDGLADASPSIESALPEPRRDEIVRELANRLRCLEERPYPLPTAPRIEPRPTQSAAPEEPSILKQYGSPNK